MHQAEQWRLAAAVLLLGVTCGCLNQSAAAQRRQLTQDDWYSQSLSLSVTITGPCNAPGYPVDVGVTFADCARKDAENLPNVLVVRVLKAAVQDAGAGSCLTRTVGGQTLAGLGVLMRLRGPNVTIVDASMLVAAGQNRGAIGGFDCNVFPTVCYFFRELGARIIANDAKYGGNSNFTMALPRSLPPPPSPVPGEKRTLLKIEDFNFLGSFAIPATIPECNTRTSWSSGGLAMQVRDNIPYFYSTANRSDGASMYEFTYSGKPSLNTGKLPLAAVTWCGNGYGTARTLTPGSQSESFLLTHGLHYSESMDRLYWTFGEEHLSSPDNAYFLAYSNLAGINRSSPTTAADASAQAASRTQPEAVTSDLAASGPWKIAPAASGDTFLHSQKVRGGVMDIPQWFADRYLGGRNLGVGFGGYYNDVMKGMSMGPSLVAVRHPGNAADTLNAPVELLGYGFGHQYITSRYCLRNSNFAFDQREFDWAKNPGHFRDQPAYWAPGDSVEGAATWVDNGTHHGLIFFPELSQGWIGADPSDQTNQTNLFDRVWTVSHWYVYDPLDLAAVARGTKNPWEVQPAQFQNITYQASTGRFVDPPTGQFRRVTGAVFDNTNQTLYLLYLHSGKEIPDFDKPFHMVHVFQLGKRKPAKPAQTDGSNPGMQPAAAAANVPHEVMAQLLQQQQQQQGQGQAAGEGAEAAASRAQPLRLKRSLR